jgi:hypothetical protein
VCWLSDCDLIRVARGTTGGCKQQRRICREIWPRLTSAIQRKLRQATRLISPRPLLKATISTPWLQAITDVINICHKSKNCFQPNQRMTIYISVTKCIAMIISRKQRAETESSGNCIPTLPVSFTKALRFPASVSFPASLGGRICHACQNLKFPSRSHRVLFVSLVSREPGREGQALLVL